jgi:hypothetical protein
MNQIFYFPHMKYGEINHVLGSFLPEKHDLKAIFFIFVV